MFYHKGHLSVAKESALPNREIKLFCQRYASYIKTKSINDKICLLYIVSLNKSRIYHV